MPAFRILLWMLSAVARGVLCLLLCLAAFFLVDQYRSTAARPPDGLSTLDEFMAWKGAKVVSRGKYDHAGQSYLVVCGPPAYFLASGPTAYLFDDRGRFVDWTSDMGDCATRKHGFRLMSGAVKEYTRSRP
jgi:hypothetical protein